MEIYNEEGEKMITLPAGKRKGINRVVWAMRGTAPRVPPSPVLQAMPAIGPLVPEGSYTVKLVKGKEAYQGKVELKLPEEFPFTPAERERRQRVNRKLYDMQSNLSELAESASSLRDQARERAKEVEDATLRGGLESFADKLDQLHGRLAASRDVKGISGE